VSGDCTADDRTADDRTALGGEQWRLIRSGPANGVWNMAVDLALLSSAIQGGPPALRIYSWRPAALSLGYNQDVAVVERTAVIAAKVDVVRRPTGGRAVLHDDEVTYSIALPPGHPLAQTGIQASYKALSQGLLAGLTQLGLHCELAQPQHSGAVVRPRAAGGGAFAACFDAPSWYELVVNGKKVVGSAQVRRRGALLQHGSIPLHLAGERLYHLLAFSDEEARRQSARMFSRKAAGLCEVASAEISPEQVEAALISGFTCGLGLQLTPGELNEQELEQANNFMVEVIA